MAGKRDDISCYLIQKKTFTVQNQKKRNFGILMSNYFMKIFSDSNKTKPKLGENFNFQFIGHKLQLFKVVQQ